MMLNNISIYKILHDKCNTHERSLNEHQFHDWYVIHDNKSAAVFSESAATCHNQAPVFQFKGASEPILQIWPDCNTMLKVAASTPRVAASCARNVAVVFNLPLTSRSTVSIVPPRVLQCTRTTVPETRL